MRRNSKSKIILRTITSVLVCLVVFLAFSVSIIRLFGFQVYGVLTGSMEPEYPVGSLIYVKEIDTSALEVGDTISFKLSENVIATHRIVELVPDETNPSIMSYRTKGDANDTVDSSLVKKEDIIGKVVFCLPQMGYFLNYIQSPTGITTTVIVSILLIGLVFVSELITSDSNSKIIWKIRGMITGSTGDDYYEDDRRRAPQRGRQAPPQRRSPRYEDDYRPQRSRAPRYEDDYRSSQRSRYDEAPRRSSRYDDDYDYRRSSRSASQNSRYSYEDEPRRTRSASSGRYSDYGETRRSAASSRSSSASGRYSDSTYRSSSRSASSGRYDDYGETRRTSSSSRSSGASGRYSDSGYRSSSRSSSYGDGSYSSRRSRYSDSDYR